MEPLDILTPLPLICEMRQPDIDWSDPTVQQDPLIRFQVANGYIRPPGPLAPTLTDLALYIQWRDRMKHQ